MEFGNMNYGQPLAQNADMSGFYVGSQPTNTGITGITGYDQSNPMGFDASSLNFGGAATPGAAGGGGGLANIFGTDGILGGAQGMGSLLGGAGSLFSAYNAMQNSKLARSQFDFQKKYANRNLSNQTALVNKSLRDRKGNRRAVFGGNKGPAMQLDNSAIA